MWGVGEGGGGDGGGGLSAVVKGKSCILALSGGFHLTVVAKIGRLWTLQ